MNSSNTLSTFNFNNNEIRVVTIDDQPWFVAADAIVVLYGSTNSFGSIYRSVDQDERSYVPRQHLGLNGGKPMVIISESGLYKLVMRSDKPEAHDFQNWVTCDVLPAIRKDGAYIMGEEKVASGEMDEDEFFAKALIMAQTKIERYRAHNEMHHPI